MAVVFFDGFDKYGPPDAGQGTNLFNLMAGDWSARSANTEYHIVAPLSAFGQALQMRSSGATPPFDLTKNIPSVSRVIGGVRFASNLVGIGGIQYTNSGAIAFSVTCNASTGLISIRTGDITGTVLATSIISVGTSTPHYLEWDVTVGASSAYQVWLDGVSLFSGSGNTGNGQTAVNQFKFAMTNINNGSITFDDLYLFDSTGAANNATLKSNPVVDTEFMTADSSVAFSFGQNTLGTAAELTSNGVRFDQLTTQCLALRKYTAAQSGNLQNVNILPGAPTNNAVKFKAVVYSDSAGSPNALLATGTEVVGFITQTLLTMPLSSPLAITGGTVYWIGFISDTPLNSYVCSDNSATSWLKQNTYSSGPPGTAGSPTSILGPAFYVWGAVTGVTGNNWSAISQNPPPMPTGNDISYVSSSTVGNEDLYTTHALQQTPSAIAVTSVKAYCRLSDAGARTVDLRLRSGATDSAGSNPGQTPSQSYQWLSTLYETDPNTSAAWTLANLNAATSGVKVAS